MTKPVDFGWHGPEAVYHEEAPEWKHINSYLEQRECYHCKSTGQFLHAKTRDNGVDVECKKCHRVTAIPYRSIHNWVDAVQRGREHQFNRMYMGTPVPPSSRVDVTSSGKITYDGKVVKSWSAKPNPYSPLHPRMSINLEGGEYLNITGQDAGDIWALAKRQAYSGGKHSGTGVLNGTKATTTIHKWGYKTPIKSPQVGIKRNPEFEKLRKFKVGTVVNLSKSKNEGQDFLIRKIDAEECAVHMSPVKGIRVSDSVFRFMSSELKGFDVKETEKSEDDLKNLHTKPLDRGPKIYCQGFYD